MTKQNVQNYMPITWKYHFGVSLMLLQNWSNFGTFSRKEVEADIKRKCPDNGSGWPLMTEPLTTTPSHRSTLSQPFPLQTLSTPITCTNRNLTLADVQAFSMVLSFHKNGIL